MDKKIALILPYYGKLPHYFNFFLRSLEGMCFDVLFFSNLDVDEYPRNFKFRQMSFEEFKHLASEKLGGSVRLDTPRRLCDFRPMYGRIFENYIKEYDYWAFGDCDLVYGSEFNDEIVAAVNEDVDVFSTQQHFIAGPFSLVRNDDRCNSLYLIADNLEEIITHAGSNLAFDELCGDFHEKLRHGEMTIEECRRHADSFSAIVQRQVDLKSIFKDVLYQDNLADGSTVEMSADGKLTATGKPIAAYHFVRAKLRRYFTYVEQPYSLITDYIIDDTGFYVTNWQKMLRRLINPMRKFKAVLTSLRKNGLARASSKWQMKA